MSVASRQIVTFRLDDDLFAADINDVERVLRYAEPTPVPNVPPWVQGVIEYRSHVVPVVDLRLRFELPAAPPNGATRIMVLSSGGEWIAAVVDAVLEVVSIGTVPLAPPPPLFAGMAADFLKGIFRRNEKLVIVLDVTRRLATKDRLAFDRAVLEDVVVPEPVAPAPAAKHPLLEEAAPVTPVVPTDSSSALSDLTIIRGSAEPAHDDILQLLGTSDEPPRPDESILRGGPAVPPTPDWGATPAPRSRPDRAEDEGTGGSDG